MISKIFKFIFKTFYGICAVLGFTMVLGGGIALYLSSVKPHTVQVKDNTFLTLNLQGDYPDHVEKESLMYLFSEGRHSLYDLLTAMDAASKDPKIKGLALVLRTPGLGLAQLQELRDAILKFKATGKHTLLYTDEFGEMRSGLLAYYFAAAFDEIWMQPIGMLNISGIRLEQPYAFEALQKIGVTPEFGSRKEYKSFTEMFTRTAPSEPSKEAEQAMLDSLTSQIVEDLAKRRNITSEQVMALIDNSPYTDLEANELKLVNRLEYRQNIKPILEERYGKEAKLNFLDLWAYEDTLKTDSDPKKDHIALVFDKGPIMSGDDREGLMHDAEINATQTYKTFMDLLKNPHVKAIVYRISSPGGSPVSSETIANVIHHAKSKSVPVIISMGDYAASGGYWVSSEGTKIFAEPFTLTGSIGVFVGKFVLKDLWEKVGIHWEGASFGQNSGLASANTPFTPEEWKHIDAYLDRVYSAFVNKVATHRKLSVEAVEKAARGRVWTGEQAQSLGLVDQLGGLQDAIAFAKETVSLPKEAGVIIYPKAKSFLEEISEKLLGTKGHEDEDTGKAFLSPFREVLRSFHTLSAHLHFYLQGGALEAPLLEIH